MSVFGFLFGKTPETADEAANLAEREVRSIEDRMEHVKNRLDKGGYKNLPENELKKLLEDLEKILEFVQTSLSIINELAPLEEKIAISVRRLRNVRTRVNKEAEAIKARREAM